MSKKFLGKFLTFVGAPSVFAGTRCLTGLVRSPIELAWALPLTLLTIPLMPFALAGSKIIDQCLLNEFKERAANLPRISLPEDYFCIEKRKGKWLVQPLYNDGEEGSFATEAEAIGFLEALEFHEVLSVDTDRLITYWVKS